MMDSWVVTVMSGHGVEGTVYGGQHIDRLLITQTGRLVDQGSKE
jgi:hypothetical protein